VSKIILTLADTTGREKISKNVLVSNNEGTRQKKILFQI